MKTLILTLLLLIAFAVFQPAANAADFTLRWDPVAGATGYKIYSSTDTGASWSAPIDAGNVTQKALTAQPDNALVLYKVSAYTATQETVAHWIGAWYDGRKKPPGNPTGAGIQ
jgi:hypothetical protein